MLHKIEFFIIVFYNYKNMDKIINDYIKTLTPLELKGFHIAKDHLKDSFDIKKSIGFLKYLKDNNIKL